MTETYCGKRCEDCYERDAMNCPGCKALPNGQCELARCVKSKGHQTCATCGFQSRCGTWKTRSRMPEARRKKAEEEAFIQASAAKRAVVLGRWLTAFFWLLLISLIARILANELFQLIDARLPVAAAVLHVVIVIVSDLVLLRLGAIEDRYRTAGISMLIYTGTWLLGMLLPAIPVSGGDTFADLPRMILLLLTFSSLIAYAFGMYNLCLANCTALTDVDNALSGRWEAIGRRFIILVLCVAPLTVTVLTLFYMYRTVKAFRSYAANAQTV